MQPDADECGRDQQPAQSGVVQADVEATEAIVAFGKQLDEVRVQLRNQQVKLLIFELCTSEGSGFARVCNPGWLPHRLPRVLGLGFPSGGTS